MANSSEQKSLVFSPLSAQIVLTQTAEGASNRTLSQLVTALHLPKKRCVTQEAIRQLNLNISTDNLKLQSANKLYIAKNYKVLESFVEVSKEIYKAEIQNVDFSENEDTAQLINKWIEQHTNNKIRNLISPNSLSSFTRLVLVNALYLNAKWTTPFQKRLTSNGTFHLNNGSTINVQMMHSNTHGSSSYNYLNSSKLKAAFLRLGFLDSNLTMTYILPDVNKGIKEIENNLEEYLEPQNYSIQRVAVALPKFEITSDVINLQSILEQVSLLFILLQYMSFIYS